MTFRLFKPRQYRKRIPLCRKCGFAKASITHNPEYKEWMETRELDWHPFD